MATSEVLPYGKMDEDDDRLTHEFKELLSSFPVDKGWNFRHFYQYRNFWHDPFSLQGVINFQRHFKAHHDDILLVTMPKSGTTWLKALTFAIINRGQYTYAQHPLLTNSPHSLVLGIETVFAANPQTDCATNLLSPRLIATHIPYISLPDSIKDLDCRIVYLCRNPRDNFISLWKFFEKLKSKPLEPISLEVAFELFCKGVSMSGPFWDHVLEYWNESLRRPTRVLFLKYEEMKADTKIVIKKLADFIGCPFSLEEERQGKLEEILRLCSFECLSNLEVNKDGILAKGIKNEFFFRKGEIGDSDNYLTPCMIEMLNKITEQKWQGSGLTFQE